jgi:hypothetical protein
MYIVRNGLLLLEWLGAPFLGRVGSGLLHTLLLSLLFLRHKSAFPRSLSCFPQRHHLHLLPLVRVRVLSRVLSNLEVSGR